MAALFILLVIPDATAAATYESIHALIELAIHKVSSILGSLGHTDSFFEARLRLSHPAAAASPWLLAVASPMLIGRRLVTARLSF